MGLFDFGSGLSDITSSDITAGSDQAVLPDVAYGGPAEQPTDPTGNGFGQWLTGSLDKALNYALQRDKMEMQYDYATRVPVVQQQQRQMVQRSNNSQLLFFGAVGLVLYLVVKKA